MSLLLDQLDQDAAFLVDTEGWGESVTYTNSAGTATAMNAVVERRLPEAIAGAPQAIAPVLEVWIRNDSSAGVTSVDRGTDTITVAAKVGGTASVHVVDQILHQDASMWHLRLR